MELGSWVIDFLSLNVWAVVQRLLNGILMRVSRLSKGFYAYCCLLLSLKLERVQFMGLLCALRVVTRGLSKFQWGNGFYLGFQDFG